MINLTNVVTGTLLGEAYSIIRSLGAFTFGGFRTTPSTITGYGVVSVAKDQDLEMVAEADRVTGAMVFHSAQEIFETEKVGGQQKVADKILWNGQTYRIVSVSPYPNRGYWKAVGVRMAGQ